MLLPQVCLSPQSQLPDIRDRGAGLRKPCNRKRPRHRQLRVLPRLRLPLPLPLLRRLSPRSPSQSQDTRVQPPDNRKPRRNPTPWETKLRDTPGRHEAVALEVTPRVGSFAVAGAGLPGEGEGRWGRRAEARAPGVTGRQVHHGEACMPGEGRRHGDTTRDGGAGGAFARDTRRGHRQRRVSRRTLGERQRAAGRTRGPVVLPPTGGGGDGGEGGERSTQRPAALGQRPDREANKRGTRTGRSFAPAACCLSSRWWQGRR